MIKSLWTMLIVVWALFVFLGQGTALSSQGMVISKDTFGVDLMFSPIHMMRKNDRDAARFLDLLERSTDLMVDANMGVLGFDILWEEIEPSLGKGFHWSELDKVMQVLHEKGLKAKVTFYPTQRQANEGSRKASGHRNWRGTVKADRFDRLCAAVQELVERYDGDGQGDAFKMEYPVLWFLALSGEIESWKHWAYYDGTPEDYDRLLDLMSSCTSKANETLLVGRGGTNFGAFFERTDLERKSLGRAGNHERFRRFLIASLEKEDNYDMFGLQYNYSWKTMVPQVDYVRTLFDRFEYEKPIYINHARSTEVGFVEALKILRDRNHRNYDQSQKRFYAVQARTTVRKAAVGLACGVRYFGVATLLDYPRLLRNRTIGAQGHEGAQWALAGLFECSWDGEKSGFFAKPAYYSYKLFIEKMMGVFSDVRRVELADSVWAFEFKRENGSTFIVWLDEETSGTEGKMHVALPVRGRKVLVTEVITHRGKTEPMTQEVPVKESRVEIKISSTPQFVEEFQTGR